jgi:hypothetical protein
MKKVIITNIRTLDGVAVSSNAQRVPLPPLNILRNPPVALDHLGALVPELPVAISLKPSAPPPPDASSSKASSTNETATATE